MPSDWAASVWPSSTEMIPARTISAMYAPSFSPSASMPATNGVISEFASKCPKLGPERDPEPDARVERRDVVPEEDLHEHRRAAEEPDVDPAAPDTSGFGDRRITASRIPSAIPIAIETTVSSSVTTRPWSTRGEVK